MTPVDEALATTLKADAALVALCTDGVVTGQITNGKPMAGTNPDYLMFVELDITPQNTQRRRAATELRYRVEAVAKREASKSHIEKAKAIRDRADNLLNDNPNLTVAGHRVGLRRTYALYGYEEDEGDQVFYRAGFFYRIRLLM